MHFLFMEALAMVSQTIEQWLSGGQVNVFGDNLPNPRPLRPLILIL